MYESNTIIEKRIEPKVKQKYNAIYRCKQLGFRVNSSKREIKIDREEFKYSIENGLHESVKFLQFNFLFRVVISNN